MKMDNLHFPCSIKDAQAAVHSLNIHMYFLGLYVLPTFGLINPRTGGCQIIPICISNRLLGPGHVGKLSLESALHVWVRGPRRWAHLGGGHQVVVPASLGLF